MWGFWVFRGRGASFFWVKFHPDLPRFGESRVVKRNQWPPAAGPGGRASLLVFLCGSRLFPKAGSKTQLRHPGGGGGGPPPPLWNGGGGGGGGGAPSSKRCCQGRKRKPGVAFVFGVGLQLRGHHKRAPDDRCD